MIGAAGALAGVSCSSPGRCWAEPVACALSASPSLRRTLTRDHRHLRPALGTVRGRRSSPAAWRWAP